MNTKHVKLAAFFGVVVLGIVVGVRPGTHAQDKAVLVSTNWVGGLVVGKKELGDTIAGRGLFPQVDGEVEIGLRSDGVVVWRKTQR